MTIKFINCTSKFSFSQLYKFSTPTYKNQEKLIIKYIGLSRIDGFPIFNIVYVSDETSLCNFNYGFTFSRIELISELEDQIYDSKPRVGESRKNNLYDLMCSILEIDPKSYLDEEKYKSSMRNLKMDNLLNISIDINE